MPAVDTPFVIGVIREKEKGLLEKDEYTRIVEAPSVAQAYQALTDTPYGVYFAADVSPYSAIASRLEDEMGWLEEVVADKWVIDFIQARYDALHIGQALLDYKSGKEAADFASKLGRITAELLTSTIWNDTSWDSVAVVWRGAMQTLRTLVIERSDDTSTQTILQTIERAYLDALKTLTASDLSRTIASLEQERSLLEQTIRPNNLPDDISTMERGWDEKLLAALRDWRSAPNGSDAIIAWWFALATEARTLRLILSAKAGGLAPAQLQVLQRSLYREWI